MMVNRKSCFVFAAVVAAMLCVNANPVVLDEYADNNGWQKTFGEKVVPSEGPGGGRAWTLSLPGSYTLTCRAPADLRYGFDAYEGIEFSVKGDGSDEWAPIGVGSSQGYSFYHYVPLKSTEWKTYTLRWDELYADGRADGPLGVKGAMPPCAIDQIRVGTRWTIREMNARVKPAKVSVSSVRLVKKVPPKKAAPRPASFAAFLAKLRAGAPVAIRCQGDSITAGTGIAEKDRAKLCYFAQLGKCLNAKLGKNSVTTSDAAVGGAHVYDLRMWTERDFADGFAPDLVTVLVGYNDKSGGDSAEKFRRNISAYVDEVMAKTGGKPAVLLIGCLPARYGRWEMMEDYSRELRAIAAEKGAAFWDAGAECRKLGRMKWAHEMLGDGVHPNAAGHAYLGERLAAFLLESK